MKAITVSVCIVLCLAIDVCAASDVVLTIGPVDVSVRNALVMAELPSARPEGSGPQLVESVSGVAVPCQISGEGRNARLVWVVSQLPKGATAHWSFSWALSPRKPEGVRHVDIEKEANGPLSVDVDGKLFTRYIEGRNEFKPYLYPVMLGDTALTRHFPMKKGVPGERVDHVHHRSLYFTHGSVNGTDFWSEKNDSGHTVHQDYLSIESGPVFGRFTTRCEWVAREGALLDDVRTHRVFSPSADVIVVDFTTTLTAKVDKVTFGDTKEGTFGIRLAGWMKQTSGGRILSSRGAEGEKGAWGKPAEWIDYSAEHNGKTYGVAILDHPTSFRHPTHWHVRGYGLFAANPFGYHNFYPEKKNLREGEHTIRKGESVTFSYRVVFHRGTTEDAKIAEYYNAFANPLKVTKGIQ